MNLLHETVEMHVLAFFDGVVLEEQVHEHGFAPADTAPHIHALGALFFPAAEGKTGAPSGATHLLTVVAEFAIEALQPVNGALLG